MTNRVRRRLVIALAAIAALSACGNSPTYGSVEEAVYAGALCTDRAGIRVPDDYCPIGDGDVDGYPYEWRYQTYRHDQPDIDIVYVGYQVAPSWTKQRPPKVRTLNIDRGSFPLEPPKGSRATSARAETAPKRAAQSARGGLGSTAGRSATAASAAPGPPPKGAVERKSLAPPPKGSRPIGSKTTKTGK